MIRLLRANVYRAIKSKTLWIGFALYAAYSILLPVLLAINNPDHYKDIPTLSVLRNGYGIIGYPLQGMFLAAISCIVLGADFHNGRLKNKLIVGHTRGRIYISNLLSTAIIALALNVIYFIFFATITLPLYGAITAPAKDVFMLLLLGTFMMLSYSAIITFVIMTCRNATIAIVICFALLLAMTFITFGLADILNNEPYYTQYTVDDFGETIETVFANPYMPSKAEMGFARFVADFFPSGQSYLLSNNGTLPNLDAYTHWQMIVYSLIIIAGTTGGGIAIFNKVNIK